MGFVFVFLKNNLKSVFRSVFTNAPESVAVHGCNRWTDSLKTMRCILLTHPYPQLHPTHSPVPALTYFCDMSRGAYPPHPPTTAPHVVARQDRNAVPIPTWWKSLGNHGDRRARGVLRLRDRYQCIRYENGWKDNSL